MEQASLLPKQFASPRLRRRDAACRRAEIITRSECLDAGAEATANPPALLRIGMCAWRQWRISRSCVAFSSSGSFHGNTVISALGASEDPVVRVPAEGSFDRAAHGRDNPPKSGGEVTVSECRAVRKSGNRGWRSSNSHYAGTQGSGAADHSDTGRFDNERGPLARRSGQRHSARHDFGQGNRCERQKPYICPRPKPEHSTGAKYGERANPPPRSPLTAPCRRDASPRRSGCQQLPSRHGRGGRGLRNPDRQAPARRSGALDPSGRSRCV